MVVAVSDSAVRSGLDGSVLVLVLVLQVAHQIGAEPNR
jgi:hypothetical protein